MITAVFLLISLVSLAIGLYLLLDLRKIFQLEKEYSALLTEFYEYENSRQARFVEAIEKQPDNIRRALLERWKPMSFYSYHPHFSAILERRWKRGMTIPVEGDWKKDGEDQLKDILSTIA